MTDSRPPMDDEVEILRQLARDARPQDNGRRPLEESVWAFVCGRATDEQRAEVVDAVKASPSFRKELLALQEQVEAARNADPKTLPSRIDGKAVDRMMGIEETSWWTRLSSFFAVDRLTAGALGAAAAAVVLFVVMRTPTTEPTLMPTPTQTHEIIATPPVLVRTVDPSVYAPTGERGPGDDEPTLIPANGEEAASLAFYDAFETIAGTVTVRPNSPAVTTSHVVRIAVGDAAPVATHWQVPTGSSQLEAWLMALPSGDLLRVPVTGDSTTVAWDPTKWGTHAAACMTYRLGDFHRATPVQEFHLR